jgi:transposase
MGRWAQPLRSRDQIVLFAPTLEDAITCDHPVRLFDEVIGRLDFTDWELRYCLFDGQPPIHPRVMASVILYGLSLGIRASRKLEDSCGNRIDFLWLTEGRVIDHSTLAGFRVKFEVELKKLFRQIGQVAIGLGMANLNQVALDGTVKRSNNSRSAVANRATLEQKLAALDQQVEQMIAQAGEADRQDKELFGESSPMKLPEALKDIRSRQKQLGKALKKAREIELRQKQHSGKSSKEGPAVPTTDVDSSLMKNKTGGFAPNYLVVLATEGENGLIMDYQVPAHGDEPSSVIPAMENLKQAYGPDQPAISGEQVAEEKGVEEKGQASQNQPESDPRVVKELLADTGFNSGRNLEQLKESRIEPWMPARKSATPQSPSYPSPPQESQTTGTDADGSTPSTALPNSVKTLDKSAFTYNQETDTYTCPAGRSLPLLRTSSEQTEGGKVTYREYQSKDCGGCPLASRCLSRKSKKRRVRRDEFEPLREEMAARMKTPEGKARYRRRSFLAETPFAVINTSMNIRQLLLRGIDKVKTEIGWICCAYNLKKLSNLVATQRQKGMPAMA